VFALLALLGYVFMIVFSGISTALYWQAYTQMKKTPMIGAVDLLMLTLFLDTVWRVVIFYQIIIQGLPAEQTVYTPLTAGVVMWIEALVMIHFVKTSVTREDGCGNGATCMKSMKVRVKR
jgi:hypothetical protein